MIAQLQAELEDGQPCMVSGSLDHPKVDGTQADEAAQKGSHESGGGTQAQKKSKVATLSNRQATWAKLSLNVKICLTKWLKLS